MTAMSDNPTTMFQNVSTAWFQERSDSRFPVRVFGECAPDSLWFKQLENGFILQGPGIRALKVRLPKLKSTDIVPRFVHSVNSQKLGPKMLIWKITKVATQSGFPKIITSPLHKLYCELHKYQDLTNLLTYEISNNV